MQQSCKHDTAATNREIIRGGVRYWADREAIKGRLQTVQFTPAHDKESRVQKTEVKIRGRKGSAEYRNRR
jgi:hypothetical protein